MEGRSGFPCLLMTMFTDTSQWERLTLPHALASTLGELMTLGGVSAEEGSTGFTACEDSPRIPDVSDAKIKVSVRPGERSISVVLVWK
jgi:hypothetical protein